MQLVLEVYPGLSNLGPEKASIQLMKGSKAALERNKKFKGLRPPHRKIRPIPGSLMMDCFFSSQSTLFRKKMKPFRFGLGPRKEKLPSLVFILYLAVKCGAKARAMPSTFTPAPAAYY